MSNENLRELIDSPNLNAAEITHRLSELGDGSMKDGLGNLWDAAHSAGASECTSYAGMIVGGVLFIGGMVHYMWWKAQSKKMKQAVSEAYTAGIAEGRKQNKQENNNDAEN